VIGSEREPGQEGRGEDAEGSLVAELKPPIHEERLPEDQPVEEQVRDQLNVCVRVNRRDEPREMYERDQRRHEKRDPPIVEPNAELRRIFAADPKNVVARDQHVEEQRAKQDEDNASSNEIRRVEVGPA
jgi:hypothetical protein